MDENITPGRRFLPPFTRRGLPSGLFDNMPSYEIVYMSLVYLDGSRISLVFEVLAKRSKEGAM